jgi:hypothetical protein
VPHAAPAFIDSSLPNAGLLPAGLPSSRPNFRGRTDKRSSGFRNAALWPALARLREEPPLFKEPEMIQQTVNVSKSAKPVTFPLGRSNRATMPLATGSPRLAKTIGIVASPAGGRP